MNELAKPFRVRSKPAFDLLLQAARRMDEAAGRGDLETSVKHGRIWISLLRTAIGVENAKP